MSNSLNEVRLIGNLGKDPEIRYTTSGTAVATLNVATTERIKIQERWEDKTEWHNVVTWGKLAEAAGQFLKKGRQVFVAGKLQTRSWDDAGTKRYATEIVAEEVIFLGGKREDNNGSAR